MSDVSLNTAMPSQHMDSAHEPLPSRPTRTRGTSAARPGRVCAFRCAYRTSLSEYDDGGLYLAAYEGDLYAFLEEDREQPAGHARLFVLNADGAQSDGESLFNLMDQRPETAAFIPLLGDSEGALSPAVCEILGEPGAASCNMLLLDRVEILPAFRGQALGLQYMQAAIRRFGMGCRLVATRPCPAAQRTGQGMTGGSRPVSRTQRRAARTKLASYCARLGFVPVRGSDLMILDLEKPRS